MLTLTSIFLYLQFSKENNVYKRSLLLGTDTGGKEQNYVYIVNVLIPDNGENFETIYPQKDYIINTHKIQHDGAVNKARTNPKYSDIFATSSDNGKVYIFDQRYSTPVATLISHKKEWYSLFVIFSYGLSWNNYQHQLLLSSSNDTTICLWYFYINI